MFMNQQHSSLFYHLYSVHFHLLTFVWLKWRKKHKIVCFFSVYMRILLANYIKYMKKMHLCAQHAHSSMFRYLSLCVCVCLCVIQTSSSLRIRSTKNVLCCQRATALKELNGDNSVVIKFPVYFPRSHLQVFLRYIALRQMPTNISVLLLLLLLFFLLSSISCSLLLLMLYLESVWINFLLILWFAYLIQLY